MKAYRGRKHIATLLDTLQSRIVMDPIFASSSRLWVLCFQCFCLLSWSKSACPFLKDIARQLLGALDVLHRECRIIHTARIVVASVAAA
jgi:serine/threonine-protein kinase SRPK3